MTPIFKMQFGSHVYGTNLPSSDQDFKGIFIPSPKDIILGRGKETINTSTNPGASKNTAEDTDLEMFSLKQYMKLLLEGQTVALTMLFAPAHNILISSPIYEEIIANRHKFLHKGISAFAGYCRQQANKYGIKGSRVAASRAATNFFEIFVARNPSTKLRDIWELIETTFTGLEHCEFINAKDTRMLSICDRKVQEHVTVKEVHRIYKHLFDEYGHRALQAESQQGVDWKALQHAVRVASEAKELLLHHTITYPRPDSPLLLQIRKGELPYQQVADIIERGLVDLEQAQLASTLPAEPDREFAENLIYRKYLTPILRTCILGET